MNKIDEEIYKLRNDMIKKGMVVGLTAKETLILSKRLDNLLYLKMILQMKRINGG